MFRLAFLIVTLGLAACGKPVSVSSPSTEHPMRIVSLDFCADQYVLKLADRDQILALSPDATRAFSFMRDEAEGLPTVRSRAEDVLILKPDLVVRSYGGGPNAGDFFERAGVPVLQVGWASSIDGQGVGTISGVVAEMANGLGQAERGEDLIVEFTQRLERVKARAVLKTALYMTPTGVTTGGNTMVHDVLLAAGLTNYSEKPGWHSLPLERLAYDRPDLVAAAFYDTKTDHGNRWSAARHPIAKRELADAEVVTLDSAWLACGGWFILEAIEALADGTPTDE